MLGHATTDISSVKSEAAAMLGHAQKPTWARYLHQNRMRSYLGMIEVWITVAMGQIKLEAKSFSTPLRPLPAAGTDGL